MIEMTHRVDHRTQELHGLAGRIRHERALHSTETSAELEAGMPFGHGLGEAATGRDGSAVRRLVRSWAGRSGHRAG